MAVGIGDGTGTALGRSRGGFTEEVATQPASSKPKIPNMKAKQFQVGRRIAHTPSLICQCEKHFGMFSFLLLICRCKKEIRNRELNLITVLENPSQNE